MSRRKAAVQGDKARMQVAAIEGPVRRGVAVEALRGAEAQARAAERAAQAARQQRDKHAEALEELSILRWTSEDSAVACGFEIVADELMLRLTVEDRRVRLSEAEARAFGEWLRAMLGTASL
jgi:hypothetical protein